MACCDEQQSAYIIIFENAGILASPHLELTIQIYPTFSIFNNSSIYSTEAPEK